MQKTLSTQLFRPYLLRQQLATTARIGLLAGLILFLFSGFANAQATGTRFDKDFVVVNGAYYYTNQVINGLPSFQGQNLGSFDRGGVLPLGGEANTFSANGDDVYTPQMYYRVYQTSPQADTPGRFASLTLDFVNADNAGTYKKWSNTTTVTNLLSSTTGAGNYILEIYFQTKATYNNSGGSGAFDFYDNGTNNSNYKATFTVTGSVPATWDGSEGDNLWFNAKNWSTNEIPASTTDVTIPLNVPRFPVIAGDIAKVRTLTIAGNSATSKATLTLQATGELQVSGDFRDTYGGLNQTGGVFTLAGTNQVFDGGNFTEVHIQGGGTKFLSINPAQTGSAQSTGSTRMNITQRLVFVTTDKGGVISTGLNNPSSNGVNLVGTTSATIIGETETSYVQGILSTTRELRQNEDFGGIGVELSQSVTGATVVVNRFTGSTSNYSGVGTKGASINRSFSFTPQNFNSQNYTLVFHYLSNELNGNAAADLNFFSAPSSSSTFTQLGRTSSSTDIKAVTLTQITSPLNSTFTLAEAAPLPVTLVSFTATATAQGAALLRWATATESNNRGFGIERHLSSSDAWQSVSFVAAGATTGSTYEFTDKSLINAPASTQAYYRLRQEDLDGKVTYSPVAVINRAAAVASTEMTLSPVPVTGANLSVGLAEAGQAGILVAVTNTQGQRVLSFTSEASTDAALSLPVTNLAAGVYIVTVQVPGQAARHARFVKL